MRNNDELTHLLFIVWNGVEYSKELILMAVRGGAAERVHAPLS